MLNRPIQPYHFLFCFHVLRGRLIGTSTRMEPLLYEFVNRENSCRLRSHGQARKALGCTSSDAAFFLYLNIRKRMFYPTMNEVQPMCVYYRVQVKQY